MSHINAHVPRFSEEGADLQHYMDRAERDFWKARAERYRSELENIPAALRDRGEWYVEVDGEATHVILDPAHHDAPPTDTEEAAR